MANVVYLAAVKRKIESRLKSSGASREIVQLAYQKVESFEEILNRMIWGSRKRLNKEIRVVTDKFKDAIHSHVSMKQSGSGETFLEDVKLEIHSFAERVKKMEEELVDELYISLPEEDDNDDVSSPIGSKMVGLSDQYSELKSKVMNEGAKFKVLALVGMGGIGKTTLARKVYEDRDVLGHFDLRVWVTVGRKCGLKEIPARIVAQLYVESDHDDVVGLLRESLKEKRYLIVLDDVWGKYVEYHLQQSYLYEKNDSKNPFPDDGNGSRVLLTTRVQQMSEIHQVIGDDLAMRLLNKEESWDLLREKVFVEESCPFKLEKFGKQIAEICDGISSYNSDNCWPIVRKREDSRILE